MVPINLRMGQSTVLRFQEKPKKVILGNSNYYSVEFIDNDVALQPQGTIPTNLFVYGMKNVYGFLLRTESGGNYDDLVQVRWKENLGEYPARAALRLSLIHETSRPNLTFPVGRLLRANIRRIQKLERKDLYIVDLALENLSKATLKLAGLEIAPTRKSVPLSPNEFVLKERILLPGQTTAARLFLSVSVKPKEFSISIRLGDTIGTQVISGKYL